LTDDRPPLGRWLARALGDEERDLGSGWISGTTSVFLGSLAVLGVLAFWFPGALSTAQFRAQYPIPLLRTLLEVAIGVALLLGAASLALRRHQVLGLAGIGLALLAVLGGGGDVPIESRFDQTYTLGLDWFVLNLLLLALVFVPLERVFPRRPEQSTFRFGWTTDGTHFLVSHLAVQAITFLSLLPAVALARFWQPEALHAWIRAQPLVLQLAAIVLTADFVQYWVHRAFHRVPWLWRFHAVHHSSRALDWLAGSRPHVVDVLATRGLVMLAVFPLGFSQPALYA
jgi:lathosterol oxidase